MTTARGGSVPGGAAYVTERAASPAGYGGKMFATRIGMRGAR